MTKAKLTIAIGIVFLMSCAGTAYAQSGTIEMQAPMTTSVTGQVRVSIPFQFTVGDREFAAGDYYITPMNDKTLSIRAVGKGPAAIVMTNSVATVGENRGPRLIFHRYGDRCFLAQTWASYSESGRELFASTEEVKLARIYNQQEVSLVVAPK